MKEDLNLHRAKMRYIKIALKRYATQQEAADALGITTKTLQNYFKNGFI